MGILSIFDTAIIILLLIICFFVGIFNSQSRQKTDEYFLARGQFKWWIIGFVAFTSNSAISVFIDIGGMAYREGLNAFNFELTGIICCVIVSILYSKVYYENKIYTTAEYIELRFSKVIAIIIAFFLIFMYITTRISIILICCTILIQQFFDIDIYTICIFLILFCGIYSVIGGQRTIIYNSIVMGIFLVIAGSLIFFFSLHEYTTKVNTSLPDSFMHLLNQNGFNFNRVFFALIIIGIWYHGANQELVQKYFAAKSKEEFRSGALFHGYLKLLILPFVILPGIWASQFNPVNDSQHIFPILIDTYIPIYLKGIVIFGLLGSGLVGLSASFNACATIFTFNFYRYLYPKANSFVLINIGKIATIVFTILSMVWMVILQSFHKELVVYVFSILTYFTPPFAVIFIVGILWRRCTNKAALITLVTGLTIGFFKFILLFLYENSNTNIKWLEDIALLNLFDFCILLFLFNLIMIVLISYLSTSSDSDNIDHLIFKFPTINSINLKSFSFSPFYFFAILLVISVFGFYYKFH